MKNKIISLFSGAALFAGLAVSPAALALDSADVSKALAGSTALELPAKAADLVAKAAAADKQEAAAAVVKAAVGVNPAAAAAIVSAVAREYPAAAPAAAVTATTLQHRQIGLITKAAAAAAPAEAARIVAALIKEFPQDFGTIAIAADEGAPSAGQEIRAVVADSVPALQPSSIHGATANFAADNGNVPVQAILSQSDSQALSSNAVVSTLVTPMLLGPGYDQTVISGTAASTRVPAPASAATAPASTVPALASTAPTTSAMPAFSPQPYSPPALSAPVLGNPFVPILGPGFGGTPPVVIGINYASPEPPYGRPPAN
jgi:hypothetical protein